MHQANPEVLPQKLGHASLRNLALQGMCYLTSEERRDLKYGVKGMEGERRAETGIRHLVIQSSK